MAGGAQKAQSLSGFDAVNQSVNNAGKQSANTVIINGVTQNRYAAGTNYAASGLALVGERGPELMLMRGGERVIPANETERIFRQAVAMRKYAAMTETYRYESATDGGSLDLIPYSAPRGGSQDGGNVTVNLSVEYHVNADGGNMADLKRAFRENDGELKRLIVSAVLEYQRNQRRRAYL